MDYNLLLVAWPNGQNIVSDFRMTPYVPPSMTQLSPISIPISLTSLLL